MSKIEFKEFVKKNPHLINLVEEKKTTWQKLYEVYDLYGESSDIWNRYDNMKNNNNQFFGIGNNMKDIFQFLKGIDLNTVQKGLNSLEKAIEAFKEIVPEKNGYQKETYEPRPKYQYFED